MSSLRRLRFVASCIFLSASGLSAQGTPPAATPPAATPPAPPFEFSGVLFANFQYRGDERARSANRFDVERAYLTFITPFREKLGIRVTTDLFQQTTPGNDGFYRGWVIRAKYAYLQYNYLENSGYRAWARAGLLQTVFIEHDERTWPRWLSTTPTERAGYFSSADAGISSSLAFPKKLGEIYATVTNGPGYTSRETDRFKDYAARLTLSPWASDSLSALRGVSASIWGYKGATASRFAEGGVGQVGEMGIGLARDRYGVQVAAITPRLSGAIQYARRTEDSETGANTVLSPRIDGDSTGSLASAYAVLKPFARADGRSAVPIWLVGRWDRVTANRQKDARYNVIIGGLGLDLSRNVSVALDYQETTPVQGNPVPAVKTYFAHLVARY